MQGTVCKQQLSAAAALPVMLAAYQNSPKSGVLVASVVLPATWAAGMQMTLIAACAGAGGGGWAWGLGEDSLHARRSLGTLETDLTNNERTKLAGRRRSPLHVLEQLAALRSEAIQGTDGSPAAARRPSVRPHCLPLQQGRSTIHCNDEA